MNRVRSLTATMLVTSLLAASLASFIATAASGAIDHLAFGLRQNALHNVQQDGVLLIEHARSTDAGTLTFASETGGEFLVTFCHTITAVSIFCVEDTEVYDRSLYSITLSFTAPPAGSVPVWSLRYDIRYAREPITKGNWAEATPVAEVPWPAPPGETQYCHVSGLEPGQIYYLAIRVVDGEGRGSALSEVIRAATLTSKEAASGISAAQ